MILQCTYRHFRRALFQAFSQNHRGYIFTLSLFPQSTDTGWFYEVTSQPLSLPIVSSVKLRLESIKNPYATAEISVSRWHPCHTACSLCPLHHLTRKKQFKEDRKPPGYLVNQISPLPPIHLLISLKLRWVRSKRKQGINYPVGMQF